MYMQLSSREIDTIKKQYKSSKSKKTIYPGTQGRKNKVLKRPFDLTGINQVPIVDGGQKSD